MKSSPLFRTRVLGAFLMATGLVFLGACGGDEGGGETSGQAPAADLAAVPDAVFVSAAPDGAKDVGEVKASAKEGDEIVIRGRVGGSKSPFVPNRAAFTLAGFSDKITACSDRPDDGCKTPWDYCCDAPADIIANSATVQVVGADGHALAGTFRGVHDIDHLTTLVIKGTVGPRPDPKVFVVNATEIFVEAK